MGARWHLAAACCAILALCTLVPVASAVGAVSEPSNALRSLRNGPSVLGRRVLVLSDDVNIGTANAAFFASLTARGFNLSIKTTSSSSTSLSLGAHGEPAFDHVMIFAVSSSFAFPTSGDLSISSLLSFAENGGNLLVATGPSVSLPIRELANQLGFDLAPSGSSFIDHFAYEVTRDTGSHSLVAVNDVTTIFASNKLSHPVVMTAAGLITGSTDLAFDLLRGNPTSLIHTDAATAAKADATPFAVGRMCTVVGALQTRTNSRVIVSSSVDLFSDKWTKATGLQFANGEKADKTGNLQFAEAAAMWLMQQSHALRVVATSHHRVGESERPPHYRIMDNVIEEYTNGRWSPLSTPTIQLEARMLDPYIRLDLTPSLSGNYSATFTLPDVYGVYTLRAMMYKSGYTFIDVPDVLPVRPFRHTDYERFIPAAYPYYATAFILMTSVSVLLVAVMYHKDGKAKTA